MKHVLFLVFLFFACLSTAQNKMDAVLKKTNKQSIPYITVEELNHKKDVVVLDTREPKEFKVSHLKNAINLGYDKFTTAAFSKLNIDKNSIIVVYCSIGIRSETIGEKLRKLGYKNIYNLYGGIFEWKNKENKVFNSNNKETDSVHTFDKQWSVYLEKGIKVYEK